jgi:hypothetical protein
MATEKLTRLRNKTRTNPQIKNHKKSHEIKIDRTTDMTQQFRTHVFTFLTPLPPSVEKTVNLYGFKYVYKPRNISLVFSQCRS